MLEEGIMIRKNLERIADSQQRIAESLESIEEKLHNSDQI